jgi:hypothetical protein
MVPTLRQSELIGRKLHVNFDVVPLAEWHQGMCIETEHANVTRGSMLTTGKIALAHIQEYPDYYRRLVRMEAQADKYWSRRGRSRPCVLI